MTGRRCRRGATTWPRATFTRCGASFLPSEGSPGEIVNVGIVGCGLVGRKRAAALGKHALVAATDLRPERAAELAVLHSGCRVEERWEDLVARPDVVVVVVATTHDSLVPVSVAAVRAGKHV